MTKVSLFVFLVVFCFPVWAESQVEFLANNTLLRDVFDLGNEALVRETVKKNPRLKGRELVIQGWVDDEIKFKYISQYILDAYKSEFSDQEISDLCTYLKNSQESGKIRSSGGLKHVVSPEMVEWTLTFWKSGTYDRFSNLNDKLFPKMPELIQELIYNRQAELERRLAKDK